MRKAILITLLSLIAGGSLLLLLEGAFIVKNRADIEKRAASGGYPNVILIVIDTLRADHLSQHGYKRNTSPALAGLISQATLFEQAYSPSSWTVPSTATIHTGLHPARHQSTRPGAVLNAQLTTIAETLKTIGYDTFGASDNTHIHRKTQFNQGFDSFTDYEGHTTAYPDMSVMLSATEDWLNRRIEKKRNRPFFLYLQPMNCHGPYKTPKPYRSVLFSRPPKKGFTYYSKLMRVIMLKGYLGDRKRVDKDLLSSLNEQYDAAVRYATDQIGYLFETLVRKNLWRNSLIIVTSDHGEELFDHGGFSHGYSLYQEVVHVPLIIKVPEQERNNRTKAMVSLMDIYPTILETVRKTAKDEIDGMSLFPFIPLPDTADPGDMSHRAKKFRKRQLILQLDWPRRGVMKAVVDRRYKYIALKSDYQKLENVSYLFDLANDAGERKNIEAKEQGLADKLNRQIRDRWRRYTEQRFEAPDNVLDSMNLEALKALGYFQ